MVHKLVKRLISGAIALTLVFNINGFAAVVTDNDGSAFITKAEFDSLKNSFQAQIDSYNQAIDSKIDGAIAAYLAGIRIMQDKNESVVCYDGNGIVSVRGRDDAKWVEGRMFIDLTFVTRRWTTTAYNLTDGGNYSGEYNIKIKTKEASPFTELAVTNVDRDTNIANWSGVASTLYKDSTYGDLLYYAGYAFGQSTSNTWLCPWQGEKAITNKKQRDWPNRHLWGLFTSATSTSGTFLNAKAAYSNLSRINEGKTLENIIITNNDIPEQRFTDYDDIVDFQNDTGEDNGHGDLDLPSYIESVNATLYYQVPAGTKDASGLYRQIKAGNKLYTLTDAVNKIQFGTSSSFTAGGGKNPYVGFCGVTNWNKLWTQTYDTIVDKVLEMGAVDVFTSGGKRHLGLVAGAPIAALSKGDHVKMKVEFEDKTKDYDIWLKPSAFLASTNPTEDSGCLNNITGAVAGTAPKSYKIQNGLGNIEFELETDSFVFLKWSYAGNNGAGGGTFLPPKTIKVVSNR